MNNVETLAKNIYTTGKLIKELVFNVQTEHIRESGLQNRYGTLSLSQLEAVKLIRQKKKVTMVELSELLMVAPPSATTMVDRLVDKGLLIRRKSKDDRRKVIVEVAKGAVDDIIRIENAVIRTFAELLGTIGAETGQHWCDALEEVRLALVKQ